MTQNPKEFEPKVREQQPEPETALEPELEGEEGVNGKAQEEIRVPEEQEKGPKKEAKEQERDRKIAGLTESIEKTKKELNEARKALGLPITAENPPSVLSEEERLEELRTELAELKQSKEKITSQEERDRLIQEEKEAIFKEILDEIFEKFRILKPREFKCIFDTGKTLKGKNIEIDLVGEIDPKIAKEMAKAFRGGVVELFLKVLKATPKLIENPEVLKKFDETLTKEAVERVTKKIEQEQGDIEESEKETNDKIESGNVGNVIEGGQEKKDNSL